MVQQTAECRPCRSRPNRPSPCSAGRRRLVREPGEGAARGGRHGPPPVAELGLAGGREPGRAGDTAGRVVVDQRPEQELSRNLPLSPSASPPLYVDVTGDDAATAKDVLAVVNYLNRSARASGEGDATRAPVPSAIRKVLPSIGASRNTLSGLELDEVLAEIAEDVAGAWERTADVA